LIETCARAKNVFVHPDALRRGIGKANRQSCHVLRDALLEAKIMTIRTSPKQFSVHMIERDPLRLTKWNIRRHGRKNETQENERIRLDEQLFLIVTTWAHNEEITRRTRGECK